MLSLRSQRAPIRTVLGWLAVVPLTACLLAACEDDGGSAKPATSTAQATAKAAAKGVEQLTKRCEQLGKACGQQDKHKEDIAKACQEAAKSQAEKGCADQVVATYDCFEKELCTGDERIWALDDFRVLAERHEKCVKEREASNKCMGGGEAK